MKRKRLDRDIWTTITEKRYFQREIADPACFPGFRGIAAVLHIDRVSRESRWNYPDGVVTVCAAGMTWLELLPFDRRYVLTAMFGEDGCIAEWYCDITGGYGFDPDGVAAFYDCWLDLIARPPCPAFPQGHVREDDRDELDAAFGTGEISERQYLDAVEEAERLKAELFSDLVRLGDICDALLRELEKEENGNRASRT